MPAILAEYSDEYKGLTTDVAVLTFLLVACVGCSPAAA
jgi:hypothetical protein